jgi:hypothetical protein
MRRLAVPKNGTEDFDRLEKLAEVLCVRLPPPHAIGSSAKSLRLDKLQRLSELG